MVHTERTAYVLTFLCGRTPPLRIWWNPRYPSVPQLHFLKKLLCSFRGFRDFLKPRCGFYVENSGLDMLMFSLSGDTQSHRKLHIDLEGSGIAMALFWGWFIQDLIPHIFTLSGRQAWCRIKGLTSGVRLGLVLNPVLAVWDLCDFVSQLFHLRNEDSDNTYLTGLL